MPNQETTIFILNPKLRILMKYSRILNREKYIYFSRIDSHEYTHDYPFEINIPDWWIKKHVLASGIEINILDF